jgi:hypothetical protein
VLVLAAGVRLSGWWLPRAALVSGALVLLLGGLANPEAWVAERNIARYEATAKLDVRYLESLGADAVPTILAGLPPEVLGCFSTTAFGATSVLDGNLEWNLGRVRAADALAAAAAAPAEASPFAGTCPPTLQP